MHEWLHHYWLYLCYTHELKVPLAFSTIIVPISTFELSSFLSPAFPLSSLLGTTAGVFLSIAHASNYLGMDLSSLKKIYYNFYLLIFLYVPCPPSPE